MGLAMPVLTEDDVAKLLKEPTPEIKAQAASKIASVHKRPDLTPKERALAESIFRVMIRDADARVRAALADQLKDNAMLPHDVALALARDVEQVAVPMLHYSLVLTDDDLVELVRTRPAAFQMAIVQRERVSEAVSEAIAVHGNEDVVGTLVKNPGADVSDRVGAKIIDLFSGSELVMDQLAQRQALPVHLAERLVTLVSENIRLQLAENHGILDALSETVIRLGRERAALDLLPHDATAPQTETFVDALRVKGRVTPSMVTRMLCTGRLLAVECALSKLCGIPRGNAQALIHDSGPLGLRSIVRAAGLPDGMHELLRIAIPLAKRFETVPPVEQRRALVGAAIAALGSRLPGEPPRDLEMLIAALERNDYGLAPERRLEVVQN
jgi:uncharacterized protein (DUF2336 family)